MSPYRYNQQSMYRYSQPTVDQYESFFSPIPLEFAQEQLNKAQEKYDIGYAGALQAKDQFGGMKVGAPDINYKNQVINQFLNDTDKMVQDQFGGDWGRASKSVARLVTDVRNNEFWQKAETMDKLREEERMLTAKYGPKAIVFKSLQNKSVYDPSTKKMINPEEMNYNVVERGDWEGSIDEILSRIKPETNIWGLSETDFGYLRSGKTTQISEEGIRKIAADENVQKAIISANPEMSDVFNKLPEQRKKWFGGEYSSLNQAIEELIKGRGKSMIFKQQDDQYYQDWMLRERLDATSKNRETPYYSSTSELPLIETENSALNEHKKIIKSIESEGKGIGITPYIDPKSGYVFNPNAMEEYKKQALIRNYTQGTIEERKNKYHADLVAKYPELSELKPDEAFKKYEEYLDNIEKESRTVANMVLEKSPTKIKQILSSNILSGNFESFKIRSTGDVVDRNNIAEKLGYKSYDELKEKFNEQKDIAPRIDFRQGKMLITMMSKKGDPVDMYFDPDKETKDVLVLGQTLSDLYYNPTTLGDNSPLLPIPNGQGLAFVVLGEGNIVKGNNKKVYLVDTTDPNENPVKMSLADANKYLAEIVDRRFNKMSGN